MNKQPDLLKLGFITSALLVLATGSAIAAPPPPPAPNVSINNATGSDNTPPPGYWKFYTPKFTKVFGDYDALELARGKRVSSNGCKHLWVDNGGDMFCFSSLAHRETFLRAYIDNARHAVAFYHKGQ